MPAGQSIRKRTSSRIMRDKLVVLISAAGPRPQDSALGTGAVVRCSRDEPAAGGTRSLGYVAGWVTGWYAYSEHVRSALCRAGERIAGFIFIGQSGRELEERPREPQTSLWKPWNPPAL